MIDNQNGRGTCLRYELEAKLIAQSFDKGRPNLVKLGFGIGIELPRKFDGEVEISR